MRKYSKMNLNTVAVIGTHLADYIDHPASSAAATAGVVGGAYSIRDLNIASVIG